MRRRAGVPRVRAVRCRIVVNPGAGPVWSSNPADALREALPDADVVELGEGDDLEALLSDPSFDVLGAAGGDGTLSAAAAIAVARDATLLVVPAGTLNHLARDLGLGGVKDAVAAVRAGTTTRMDVGVVGDRTFVNTLSFGGYPELVDRRERWEGRIGKWPALVLSLAVELRRMQPLALEVDGERRRVWTGWIGNGAYEPSGFVPSRRERLDEGVLDVRLVLADRRWSRVRVVAAAALGRLDRCPSHHRWLARTVHLRSLDGPVRLAADGEPFDGDADLDVSKRPEALRVAIPPRE